MKKEQNHTPVPPQWALRLFRRFCHRALADEVEGNMLELYDQRVEKYGKKKANRLFIKETFQLFRPGIISPLSDSLHINHYAMFKSNMTIAWRNLAKNRVFSIINISGLAVAITTVLLAFLFIQDELSYDKHFQNSDNIYRLLVHDSAEVNVAPIHPAVFMPYVLGECPEIKEASEIITYGDLSFDINGHVFSEEKAMFADSSFFRIFDARFLFGQPETALVSPRSVVISDEYARKYFGDTDPRGRQITLNNSINLSVTGVVSSFSRHSHLKAEAFISNDVLSGLQQDIFEKWSITGFQFYFLLHEGVDIQSLEEKIKNVRQKNQPDQAQANTVPEYKLQSLEDIYLHSAHIQWDFIKKSDIHIVAAFSIVGLIVLLVACFNYLSMSIMMAKGRAREVGVKKTLGAKNSQIISRFVTESVLLVALSFLFAILSTALVLPWFNLWTEKSLTLNLFNPVFYAVSGLLMVVIILLSGVMPAIFLSKLRPTITINNLKEIGGGKYRLLFRHALSNLQFIMAVSLVFGALVVGRQVDLMVNQELGFDKKGLISIENNVPDTVIEKHYDHYKTQLVSYPFITGVTASFNTPGSNRINNGTTLRLEGTPVNNEVRTGLIKVKDNFFEVTGCEILAGRSFSEEIESDQGYSVVLNETAVKALGEDIQSIVGKDIFFGQNRNPDRPRKVVGVVEDIQYFSLKNSGRPVVYYYGGFTAANILVRTTGEDLSSAIDEMEKTWKGLSPDRPFNYQFVDQMLENNYRAEIKTGQIINVFTGIAVFLSCLGLVGLLGSILNGKVKEIALRKICGAKIRNIYLNVARGTMYNLLLSMIISFPISWYVMNNWLQDYAYKTEVTWEMAALVAGLSLGVVLITISFQTIRAARANPVDALKVE